MVQDQLWEGFPLFEPAPYAYALGTTEFASDQLSVKIFFHYIANLISRRSPSDDSTIRFSYAKPAVILKER